MTFLLIELNEATRILYATNNQLEILNNRRDELQLVVDFDGQELSKIVEKLLSTNKLPDD